MSLKRIFKIFRGPENNPKNLEGIVETSTTHLAPEPTTSEVTMEPPLSTSTGTEVLEKNQSEEEESKSDIILYYLTAGTSSLALGTGAYLLIKVDRKFVHDYYVGKSYSFIQGTIGDINKIIGKYMFNKQDLEVWESLKIKLSMIAGYPGNSEPIVKISKDQQELLKRIINDTSFITLQEYDKIPPGTITYQNEDGTHIITTYTPKEWNSAIKKTDILNHSLEEQKDALVDILTQQVTQENNLDLIGALTCLFVAGVSFYWLMKSVFLNGKKGASSTNSSIESKTSDPKISSPKQEESHSLKSPDYSTLTMASIDELIAGEKQKSLYYRFDALSYIIHMADSIDLAKYEVINNFLKDKQNYLIRELKKRGIKADRATELSSLDVPDNYLKGTIGKYDELKKVLESKKNESNQLSNHPELEAILKGKNLKEYSSKTPDEEITAEKSKIDYSEGNYLWSKRCENLKKYFSIEKNQKKELLEYAFNVLSDEAEKLKANDGTAKITAYEKNLNSFKEALSDIARTHYRKY
ncbi:MAG TPA: hypothetical protein PLX15_05185 [Candidatus Woesearchaeota archaeon]|nr:hypothetical protein [Candidatus Woesearchaeota archaeon]